MSSKASNQEAALKRRLQVFLADLTKVGTTQGFKHFSCYIRGKEELVISIKNTLPASTVTTAAPGAIPVTVTSQRVYRKQSLKQSDSLNSACLPYDESRLTLSYSTQVGLSGMGKVGVGLPPASPSEMEPSQDDEVTNFLIAGYSRYSCPYVWIRSNHQRLMKMPANAGIEKDSPLRLKSTRRWHEADVYVYEIIAELVKLCMHPVPRNPFELDFGYFHNLSQPFQCMATAAMISFQDRIITHSPDTCPYHRKVFQEHQLLSKIHFNSLYDLMKNGNVPILKQLKQPGKSHQQQQQQSSSSSSSVPYYHAGQILRRTRTFHSQHQNYSDATTTTPNPNVASNPSAIRSTAPVNNAEAVRYGQGPRGAFPGGFDRMPAPTMF